MLQQDKGRKSKVLIKNNKTNKIHKGIIKGDYRAKLIKNKQQDAPKNLKVYNSICGFINNEANVDFIENGDDNLINCSFCKKKLNL
ncbi:MAG: hypothetical protein ACOC1K_03170 [Nanoarchaeota archaeon]